MSIATKKNPRNKLWACEFTVFPYGAPAHLFRSLFPSRDGTWGGAGLPLVPAVWFQSAHQLRRATPWPPSCELLPLRFQDLSTRQLHHRNSGFAAKPEPRLSHPGPPSKRETHLRNRPAHLPLRGWRQRVPRTRPPLRANRRTCDDDRRPGRSSEWACRFAAHSDQRLTFRPADSPRLLGLSSLMSAPCSGRQGLRPLAPPLLTGAAHQLTFAGYAGFCRPIERAVRSASVPSQFGGFIFIHPAFPPALVRNLAAFCNLAD